MNCPYDRCGFSNHLYLLFLANEVVITNYVKPAA
jgi:hypothetical protein